MASRSRAAIRCLTHRVQTPTACPLNGCQRPPKVTTRPVAHQNFFHDQIQVGSVLQLRAPAGHFHIDAGNGPVVLIAGGIGITPMLSMLNWSLATQPGREVWLFYERATALS